MGNAWSLRSRHAPVVRVTVVALLVLASTLSFVGRVPPARATAGKLQVGVLWCALKGTDLAAPGVDVNMALWKLHEVATDHVFEPQANVTLRSAFVARMLQSASFKVINDPASSPGDEGDVRRPEAGDDNSDDEFNKARDDCRKAYQDDQNTRAAAIDGIVGIYIENFVNASGTAFPGTNGQGGFFFTTTGPADICAEPPTGEFSLNSTVMIEQSVRSLPEATQGALIGHEFGHALTLGHGNGTDDDGDGKVDADCDLTDEGESSANNCKTPQTVMTPFRCFNSNGTHLTPIQIARSKAAALKIPMTVDPPDPVPGPVVSDSRVDDVNDVVQEGIDLSTLTVAQNSATNNTLLAHKLFGDAPVHATNADYTTFVDTDGNPVTGGAPSTLGFATGFLGAELITTAQVRFHESGEFDFQTVTPKVWKFIGGVFVEVIDSRIEAGKDTQQGSHIPVPRVDMVWVRIPNDIRGPVTNPLRLQVLTDGDEGGLVGDEKDRLPEALDGAVNARIEEPVYPTCSVSPDPIRPGAIATVAVSGLIPNLGAHVVFGSTEIATGTTDAQGNASIQFRIPPDSRLGFRLVTVGSDGTALTGDCSVDVQGTPVNLPPSLTVPGNQTAQYSDPLTFGISAVDLDNDPITLSASGLPSALTFTDNGNGTGTVSGTLQVQAGSYPVTFSASDGQNPAVSASLNVIVTREDAIVTPSATNPMAVKVASPGGTSPPVTLVTSIVEVADGSPGNISNAVPVTFTLTPTLTSGVRTCTATTSGGGVGGTLAASCTFTTLPVDLYDVTIAIGGNFYQGQTETILAIYDPSLGYVTGGGEVTHNGVRSTFGFVAKYLKNGKIQGRVTYIEHRDTGNVTLKSNAMKSMSIVGDSAVIVGKATLDGVGNYEFRLTAVDHGEAGTDDRFGLDVRDPNRVIVASLTYAPIVIDSGNIVVPHKSGKP